MKKITCENHLSNWPLKYEAFSNNNERLIMFDSCADMIELVHADGFLRKESNGSWMFGMDEKYQTAATTGEALATGNIDEQYTDLVNREKDKFMQRFPQFTELRYTATETRRRRVFNEFDGELDIDRYMNQDDNCFAKLQRVQQQKKAVRVVIELGFGGLEEAKTFTTKMAAGLAIVDVMTTAGIAVELYASDTTVRCLNGCRMFTSAVKMKAADEPVDMARLSTFMLPGFTRYYLFALTYNLGKKYEINGIGSTNEDIEKADRVQEYMQADIYLPFKWIDTFNLTNQIRKLIGHEPLTHSEYKAITA